jgi:hypothetical protein
MGGDKVHTSLVSAKRRWIAYSCLLFGVIFSLRGHCAPGGTFVFTVDSVSGDVGTQVTVPVRAINFDSIISIQGTVAFDSSKLSFASVQGFGLPSMTNANFGTSYIANGKLTFSWNEQSLNPITVADSSILFEVTFDIIGSPGDQVPVLIVGSPTLIEVVDWTFTPIPFLTRSGNVSINIYPPCWFPDSLGANNITQTSAELQWFSYNPGATFLLEWGLWGFTPGNGIGTFTGTSIAFFNASTVTNLQPGTNYEFYVREECDSLNSVTAGPYGFATPGMPAAIIIFADSVTAMPSQTIAVPVRVKNFQTMQSMQGTVQWDSNIAAYDTLTLGSLPGYSLSNFGLTQTAQGIITFSWNDAGMFMPSISDSGILFTIHFQLMGSPGTSTAISFPDTPVQKEFVQWNLVVLGDTSINGFLQIQDTVVGIAQPHPAKLAIYPNPMSTATSRFRMETALNQGEVKSMELVQPNGQVLENAIHWTQSGSTLICTIKTPVAEGLWFLRLETAAGPQYGRLVIDNE